MNLYILLVLVFITCSSSITSKYLDEEMFGTICTPDRHALLKYPEKIRYENCKKHTIDVMENVVCPDDNEVIGVIINTHRVDEENKISNYILTCCEKYVDPVGRKIESTI